MRLWRTSTIFKPGRMYLHQQGPSHSTVMHEQALPTQQEPRFLSKTQPSTNGSIETLISQIPLVQTLRKSHIYKESRPHLAIPPATRQHHFVGGSLAGPGKLAMAPFTWTTSEGGTSSVVSVFHIGHDLCGHPGFVHGGLLGVLFDEVFARCVSAAFSSGLGMTANLNVDFRKPALPDRVYVLRANTVKVEGRKAWVEGRMTYLPAVVKDGESVVKEEELREDCEGAVMVSEAKALFIEPKFADVSLT